MQSNGHRFGLAINVDGAEELEAVLRGAIALHAFWNAREFYLWAERIVHLSGAKSSGVERACDEFPEGIEVRELGLRRIVVMCRTIMHIGGEPDYIADFVLFDEAE